jgi:hypothetical protein
MSLYALPQHLGACLPPVNTITPRSPDDPLQLGCPATSADRRLSCHRSRHCTPSRRTPELVYLSPTPSRLPLLPHFGASLPPLDTSHLAAQTIFLNSAAPPSSPAAAAPPAVTPQPPPGPPIPAAAVPSPALGSLPGLSKARQQPGSAPPLQTLPPTSAAASAAQPPHKPISLHRRNNHRPQTAANAHAT